MTRRLQSSFAPIRAEITFRRFHTDTHQPILEYMDLAYSERLPVFRELLKNRQKISPFLELGAETAANSLALVNEMDATGAAGDISWDSLRAIKVYSGLMKKEKLPSRIVLDAHNLPFLPGSLPLIFSWGSMHHFENPEIVLSEVKRVLAKGGLFFFDGEPVKRKLSANLWTTGAYQFMNGFSKRMLEIGLLPYLAAIDGAESMRMGVNETKPPMEQWEKLMTAFDEVKWRYSPYITADILSAGEFIQKVVAKIVGPAKAPRAVVSLFGGAVGGACTVNEKKDSPLPAKDIESALGCPDCMEGNNRPAVLKTGYGLKCENCGRIFRQKDGLVYMLSKDTEKALKDLLPTF